MGGHVPITIPMSSTARLSATRTHTMRQGNRAAHILLLVGALASSALVAGCFHHHPYNAWMSVEEPSYERWERATHRDHKLYNVRADDEQQAYWQWRGVNR
jgi:hypothetical protein